MEELLRELVEAPSVSGYEDDISALIKKELKPHVDQVRSDRIGNVIAVKGKGSPKIMLAAHMDKIGLIVKYVNKDGFIFFDKLGGWDERILPARNVVIHGSKGPVAGVIGCKPVHLQERDEAKKPIKLKEMFIDIGATSEGDVKKAGISVGDHITNAGTLRKLRGSRVTGHGFDNRIGCLVLLEIAKSVKIFKGTLFLVGTVKEEIGLIGVRGSSFSVNPDVLLAIDTTIPGDVPGMSSEEAPLKLGSGPSLEIKDQVSVVCSQVKKWVTETAKRGKIKIQLNVSSGGATDASIVPTVREGIPSGAITVPTRNIHSPVEVADMRDVNNCVKLGVKLVESAHRYF
ncbi:MAG: M42 family metallopeptidase [Candidatus Aenigmarchaeota archaeon]|nr:M42 family metallopeptidase [Candidatus Aenigmarchaeota archaeon]